MKQENLLRILKCFYLHVKDENGNPVDEEEANRRIYKIISHAMDKADNKDDLMRELGH